MIKINTELTHQSGWSTTEGILQINSYTVTSTVQLTSGNTMPIQTGKTVNINYSVYKDMDSFNEGASAFTPANTGFPYGISSGVTSSTVTESTVYNIAKAKLNSLGFDNLFV